jgi:hypothetical protein
MAAEDQARSQSLSMRRAYEMSAPMMVHRAMSEEVVAARG